MTQSCSRISNPLLVLDAHGRVVFGNQGKPKDVDGWMDNHDRAVELLEEAAEKMGIASDDPNRRNTKPRNFGGSFGGGQTVSGVHVSAEPREPDIEPGTSEYRDGEGYRYDQLVAQSRRVQTHSCIHRPYVRPTWRGATI